MSETVATVTILVSTAVIIAVDVYLAVSDGQKTISQVITKASLKNPIIPFAVGVLCGHWWWS